MSVEIGTPHAAAPGPPALNSRYTPAGTSRPPTAPSEGAVRARTPRSSPSAVSREISRPTLRKNSTMSPSLTQCRRSSPNSAVPSRSVSSVCQNSS